MIRLSRESMEDDFVKYLETVFEHPEKKSHNKRKTRTRRIFQHIQSVRVDP